MTVAYLELSGQGCIILLPEHVN